MTDDDLIDRAAEALADHVLGAKWVCVCGVECWQADAGNGAECVTASYGYHREHQARAVLDAIDLPGLLAVAKAQELRKLAANVDPTGYGWARSAEAERFKARLLYRADRIDPDKKEQDRG